MNFDVKGIDLDGITKMVGAVDKYKKNVTKLVGDITSVPNKMIDAAIKGPKAQESYKAGVTRLKENAEAIIKKMDQFAAVLNNEIRNRYESGEENISSSSFGAVK